MIPSHCQATHSPSFRLSVQLNEHEVQLRLKELQIEQLNARISEQESARQKSVLSSSNSHTNTSVFPSSITIANEHEAQLRILQYQLDERNASLTILEALREESSLLDRLLTPTCALTIVATGLP